MHCPTNTYIEHMVTVPLDYFSSLCSGHARQLRAGLIRVELCRVLLEVSFFASISGNPNEDTSEMFYLIRQPAV
jgi:hypothetical protein